MKAPLTPEPWKARTIGSRWPAAVPGGTWTSAVRRRPPLRTVTRRVSDTGATRHAADPAEVAASARGGAGATAATAARATAARPARRRAQPSLTAGRLVRGGGRELVEVRAGQAGAGTDIPAVVLGPGAGRVARRDRVALGAAAGEHEPDLSGPHEPDEARERDERL